MNLNPMLAKTFDIEKFKDYPVGISAKLDGVRCIAYYEQYDIILKSRTGKEFKFKNHIREALFEILDDEEIILDGELYTHGVSFSNIIRLVTPKKTVPKDEKRLHYYIFDCFGPKMKDKTYEERMDYLHKLNDSLTQEAKKCIKLVDYEVAAHKPDIIHFHDKYAHKGYEGVIIRILDSLYENKRTNKLMKYKNFVDKEFEIIDYQDGKGKDKGAIIFIVKYNDDRTFKVRPSEPINKRKEMFKNGDKYIGQMYTVRFQPDPNDSNNLPRFPVGVAFRNYE